MKDREPAARPDGAAERDSRMAARFRELFGDRGAVASWRAPGRVNLIGEHTDYNGLPVLPMAIPFDVRIRCRGRKDATIRIGNTSQRFGERAFAVEASIPPFDPGDWGNYAKAAVQGIIEKEGWDSRVWRGFDAVVDGTVPRAAGLSSSSALVVAFGLVFSEVNGIMCDRRELADRMADAERYVGTRGGGMDQAVCLLAEEGHALLIDFFPLRPASIPVPDDAAFVVCDSLVAAPKSREAREGYNRRSLECRLAAAILARKESSPAAGPDATPRLGDLAARNTAASLLHRLEEALPDRAWTPETVARCLETSVEALAGDWFEPYGVPLHPSEPLEIASRARHVLTEGERVNRAADALRRGDLEALGALMNESHKSCAHDFEISTPELDRLVAAALRHGAIGSRLTGAGFGGCTVSLVPRKRVGEFSAGVARDYYGTGMEPGSSEAPPIYECFPAPGASKLA